LAIFRFCFQELLGVLPLINEARKRLHDRDFASPRSGSAGRLPISPDKNSLPK
jgi:hypothetical protein